MCDDKIYEEENMKLEKIRKDMISYVKIKKGKSLA
jgi:hypothetical protein